MKNLIITIAFIFTLNTYGQKIYNLDAPKTEMQIIGKSTKTNDFAILKTIKYPMYVSAKGKLFIVSRNKKGLFTKKYIN